jgi:hypothetical protein
MAHYEIISSNFLSAPAALLPSGVFDPYPGLIISAYIPGYSASGVALLQFNADTGANYSFSMSDDLAVVTKANGQAGIPLSVTANLAIAEWIMTIQNVGVQSKGLSWQGTGGILASANPVLLLGAGVWGNNSSPITQVQLNSGAVNMNAGTRIAIIGVQP